MDMFKYLLAFFCLASQSPACFSSDSINVVLVPDPFMCHQLGVDLAVSDYSTLGILGTYDCDSDRPTYGSSNSRVDNTFSRILIPWRYSWRGVFRDGYFVQAMVGMEKSEFSSDAGSSADVSFTDIGLYGGYQWFWSSGFNVSALLGTAILVRNSVDKDIIPAENAEVVDFLDRNTKTNAHLGIGIVLGWSF